jgi:CRISPR-associated endonuclease/helicase Cas3
MDEPHTQLWAKSADKRSKFYPQGEMLLEHSLNVARAAIVICQRLPFPVEEREELARVLSEAGAFHDLGKAATGFQDMLRYQERWGHRHETLSTAIARVINPEMDKCALFAVLTHHRSIPPEIAEERGEKYLPINELPPRFGGATEDDSQWRKMIGELRANWDALQDLLVHLSHDLSFSLQPISKDDALFDLGLDNKWLLRRRQLEVQSDEQRRRASLLRGLLITSDHIASSIDSTTGDHPQIPDIPDLTDYESKIKQQELKGYSLLPFQQRAAQTTGNAILKAPTGSGKTLAALLWAVNNQADNGRFFYALPYTASINAMSDRFKDIFKSEEEEAEGVKQDLVGVLHHRNADYLFRAMEDDEMSVQLRNEQARHLGSLAREMYHPIRICTPHQILRFALCGRGWETGLSEFPRACFVFDEIHAFEPLLAGLTLATIKLLQNPPFDAQVLFASATIPRFLEQIIKEEIKIDEVNIIAPDPQDDFDKRVCNKVRHRIEVHVGSLLGTLDEIADEIEESGETALIVCNHVAVSQQVWRFLREERNFDNALLLHARFNGEDRNRIEQAITAKKSKEEKEEERRLVAAKKTKPRLLVATQAVEVSLDIDYDRGYSEPAPADALGQRLGRINRSGSRPHPARVVIFSEPSNGYLYDESLTSRTVELLRAVRDLTEAELTSIVDKVYDEGYPPAAMEEFRRGLKNPFITSFASEIIAGTHRPWTDEILDASDGQIEVLPYSLLNEFRKRRKEKRYLEANQLLVPIRVGQMHKARKSSALQYDTDIREFVTNLAYSSHEGMRFDAQADNIL